MASQSRIECQIEVSNTNDMHGESSETQTQHKRIIIIGTKRFDIAFDVHCTGIPLLWHHHRLPSSTTSMATKASMATTVITQYYTKQHIFDELFSRANIFFLRSLTRACWFGKRLNQAVFGRNLCAPMPS